MDISVVTATVVVRRKACRNAGITSHGLTGRIPDVPHNPGQRAYNILLQRRPMAAQCATAAFLFGAGDVIAQQGVEKVGLNKHDFARTARLTFYGGCLFGPIMTKWYGFLNRIKFASPTRAVIYRVWLDQAILTPAAVGFFFGSMSLLEGKPQEAIPRIQAAYVPTIIRNWGVFIPTQIINFSVVPNHMRFLFVSVVSLFWNTYLSLVNAKEKEAQEIPSKDQTEKLISEASAVVE